jgi:hypothetical protein
MKSLRKINRTHKKRNTNKKTQRRYGRSKRVTQKGGILGFTGKERRAKCSYPEGTLDSVIHEVFHQLNKIQNWKGQEKTTYFGTNPEKKVKLHKDRLDASLRQLDCDMLNTLSKIYNEYGKKTGGDPRAEVPQGIVRNTKQLFEPTKVNYNENSLTELVKPERLNKVKPDPMSNYQFPDSDSDNEELATIELPKRPNDDKYPTTGPYVKPDYDSIDALNAISDYLIELKDCSKDMFLDAKGEEITNKKDHIKSLIKNFGDGISLNNIKNEVCNMRDIEIGNNLKIIEKLKAGNLKNMQITRHGPSCNNISSMARKVMEPNLTNKGIERLIDHKKDNRVMFQSNHIFVSPLLRTWMTAIILYGFDTRDVPRQIFLLITPFLKEHFQKGFKNGNFPIDLEDQINRIVKFLNELLPILSTKGLGSNNLTKSIYIQFPKILKNDSKGFGTILITFDESEEKYKVLGNPIDKTFDLYGLRNWSKSYFKSTSASLLGYFTKPNTQSKGNYEDKYNYVFNGELGDFIKWLNLHKQALSDYLGGETIHIVAHSNLMKSGMKSINKYLEDKGKKIHELTKKITDTNAWTLFIKDFDYSTINITAGIPKKVKGDPQWDKNTQCKEKTKESEEDNTSRAKLANLFNRK